MREKCDEAICKVLKPYDKTHLGDAQRVRLDHCHCPEAAGDYVGHFHFERY